MQERRLAAIMFTDIAGYTALMGSDEDRAFKVLQKNREIHSRFIKDFNGTLIKELGDGMLLTFSLASEAVRCAIQIQKAARSHEIPLKIGIHVGEISFEGNDVHGDGVNIASRIEEETRQGCILISSSVYRDIKNKADIFTEFLDKRHFKNVDEPIKLYRVTFDTENEKLKTTKAKSKKSKSKRTIRILRVALPIAVLLLILVSISIFLLRQKKGTQFPDATTSEKLEKSIAVLPFDYLSEDMQKQYQADGVVNSITNHLTKIKELRVIATSLERYRENTQDVREIGRELNVSYLLGGSFQMFEGIALLTVRLINASDGSHVWSAEYNREWKDIMAVQSDVAQAVVNEIKVLITPEEAAEMKTLSTLEVTAYDFYLRGEDYRLRSYEEQDYVYAIQMFEKAIEIDPNYTLAWIGLASAYRSIYWFRYDRSKELLQKTKQCLDNAINLSPNSKDVLIEKGRYFYQCKLEFNKAIKIFEELKEGYPKDDALLFWAGMVYRRMGNFVTSAEYNDQAITLNPTNWLHKLNMGLTMQALREYEKSEQYQKEVSALNPNIDDTFWYLLRIYMLEGEVEKAIDYSKKNQTFIDNPYASLIKSNVETLNRNYQNAIRIIEAIPGESIDDGDYYSSKHLPIALNFALLGKGLQARIHYDSERLFLEEKLEYVKNDVRIFRSLGIVHAGLGNNSEALKYGKKAMKLLDFEKDAISGFYTNFDMAKIYLLLGEYDEALNILEFLLSKTGYISTAILKIDPFWDPLREMDRYKKLISNPAYQSSLLSNL